MRTLIDRIRNEPAFVGSLIIIAFDGLVVFDVIALTVEQFGWLNGAMVLVFGAGVRHSVYSKKTYQALEGELADQ